MFWSLRLAEGEDIVMDNISRKEEMPSVGYNQCLGREFGLAHILT
jgi:hypothetical protein